MLRFEHRRWRRVAEASFAVELDMNRMALVKVVICLAVSSGFGRFGMALAASCTPTSTTACMNLTSPGLNNGSGYVVDNVYISPYTALVNGVSTTVICDEFTADSYLGEMWAASVSSVSQLGSSVIGGGTNQQGYNEVAWLAEQLLAPANANLTAQTDISFAIWSIFEPASVSSYLMQDFGDTATYKGAMYWVNQANAQTFSAGEFANVQIYTPTSTAPTCGGGACPSGPPQEFISVTAPESSMVALLAIDFLGLAALVYFLRRERKPAA